MGLIQPIAFDVVETAQKSACPHLLRLHSLHETMQAWLYNSLKLDLIRDMLS